MAAYNHAGAASSLAHAFSKYAPERPLLTELVPGIGRADLAAAIIGNLSHRVKCNKTDLDVLQILIGYTRGNHDRVWTSYKRIKGRAEQCFAGWKGCCVKTVQRAVHFWLREFPVLRLIDNPEERYAGDGEHLWIDAGNEKKGEGPVNHYDLSGLKPYVPEYLIRAFEALIEGGQFCPPPVLPFIPIDVELRMGGDPFDEAGDAVRDARNAMRDRRKARPVSKTAAAMRPMPRAEQDADVDFDFDPFADLPENSPRSRQGSSNLIGMTLNISGGTPEAGNRNVVMSHINNDENGPEKSSPNRPAEAAMEVTKKSSVATRYADVPAGANIMANSGSQGGKQNGQNAPQKYKFVAVLDRFSREVQALVQRGVDLPMARKIYKELGDKKVRSLLVYANEQGARDGETKGPGWITQVYKAIAAETPQNPVTFPDDIQAIIERTEASYQQVLWNHARADRARAEIQTRTPPTATPKPQPPVVSLSIQETHLVPADAAFLLPAPEPDLALAALMADLNRFSSTPPPPPERKAPALPPSLPKLPDVPPEIAAAWPAFLRIVADVVSPASVPLVRGLRGAAYRREGEESVAVELTTGNKFAFATFTGKPQLVQTVQSALAEALGIGSGQLKVSIAFQERAD